MRVETIDFMDSSSHSRIDYSDNIIESATGCRSILDSLKLGFLQFEVPQISNNM
jgi:hypothetical protein